MQLWAIAVHRTEPNRTRNQTPDDSESYLEYLASTPPRSAMAPSK
jgi:hypothetical protein